MIEDDTAQAPTCASCDEPIEQTYCPNCGERRLESDALSMRRFLANSLAAITEADGRLRQTLVALVVRPGRLTLEWLRGRRRPYLRPVQIFLLANIVYFFVQPMTGFTGFNTPLASHEQRQIYSDAFQIERLVEERVTASQLSEEEFRLLFDARAETHATTLIFTMVPLFALLLLLLFPLRDPPVRHLVFATHYYAWELLIVDSAFLLAWTHLLNPARRLATWMLGAGTDAAQLASTLLGEMAATPLILVFLYFATRRAYGVGRLGAVLRLPVFFVGLGLITFAYRLLLFWVTWWTM